MAKKRTGEPEITYVVIADCFDGSSKRVQLDAMDSAAALGYALDTGRLPKEEYCTYRVMLRSQWRRLQKAEREGQKNGSVIKLPTKRRPSTCKSIAMGGA